MQQAAKLSTIASKIKGIFKVGRKVKKPKWKLHEEKVAKDALALSKGRKSGSQVHLDVTTVDNAGKVRVYRIIIDNLYDTGKGTYQLLDAKYSRVKDLSKVTSKELRNSFTKNQKPVYDAIGGVGKNGEKVVKVESIGEAATDMGLKKGLTIRIEPKVKVGTNDPSTGGVIYRDYP